METAFSPTIKPVKKKRDQSKRRASYQPKITTNGRPTKRTPEVEKALIAAIEIGAPFRVACLSCAISEDAFTEWRRKDPDFARRVDLASGKMALRLLKKIEKNADENFSAAAWLLERRFPESFSRPEIQLGLTVNNQVTNNTLVITAEVAEKLGRRNSLLNKQLDEISQNYESRQKQLNGTSPEVIREVESSASSLVESDSVIALPPPAGRNRGWWHSLSSGDGNRSLSAPAAEYALRAVVTEVSGGARAGGLQVSWASETPTLADLWSAINETAGEGGWSALVGRGTLKEGPPGSTRR